MSTDQKTECLEKIMDDASKNINNQKELDAFNFIKELFENAPVNSPLFQLKEEINLLHKKEKTPEIIKKLVTDILIPIVMAGNISTLTDKDKYKDSTENRETIEAIDKNINEWKQNQNDCFEELIKLYKCYQINILRAEMDLSDPGFYDDTYKFMKHYHYTEILKNMK